MKEIKVNPKREQIFHLMKQLLGILAILVGILGIVFPILPGWILIFVGLELLGIKIVLFDNIKNYVKEKINRKK